MPSSGRTAKKVIPWDTEPPFTLPPGTDSCPVPTCSAYGKKFEPYWRVNEHMKTDHGWPRKSLQPLSDRRLSKKLKAQRLRERGLSEGSSSLSAESASENEDGSKIKRKRKFSEAGLTNTPITQPISTNGIVNGYIETGHVQSSHISKVNNVSTGSRTLPTIANLLNHDVKVEKVEKPSKFDAYSSLLRLSTRTPPRKSPPRRRPTIPQDVNVPFALIDEELNAAGRKFAQSCIANVHNTYGSASVDPHRVAEKLNRLIDSKSFKINSILSPPKSRAMLQIYRILADDSRAATNTVQLNQLDHALEEMLRSHPSEHVEMNGGPSFHNTFATGAFPPDYGIVSPPASNRLKVLAPKPPH